MTREEAINILNILKKYYNDRNEDSYVGFDNEDNEAFDLAIKALEHWPCDDLGEISDGYHTFNQLYHQRAILFAAIVNQNTDISWKSYKHSDGKYCFDSNGEWFIVGVDTPEGSYTYHYSKEYWDYFKCKELDCGKEWDGHTEEDVTRLLSLDQQPCGDCISRKEATDRFDLVQSDDKCMGYDDIMAFLLSLPTVEPKPKTGHWEYVKYDDDPGVGNWHCSKCKYIVVECFNRDAEGRIPRYKYCSNCGCYMVDDSQESEDNV